MHQSDVCATEYAPLDLMRVGAYVGVMPNTPIPSATVCERLSIDRSTLSRWVAAGRITPTLRLPGLTGAMLFDPKDVERLARDLRSAS